MKEPLRVLQSKAETRAFYDKISRIYDLMAEHSEGPVRRAGLEMLQTQPGEHVLEIGYGTGHCLVDLAAAVGRQGQVHGIDLSEGMRDQARKRLEDSGLLNRVDLTCGDGAKLPYASESLNAIFMSFTLELFDSPEIPVVLTECHRVLTPAGRIGVLSLSKEGDPSAMVGIYEWTHRHFPNFLDCRPIYAARELEEAGFRIAGHKQMNMWVPVDVIVALKSTKAGPSPPL